MESATPQEVVDFLLAQQVISAAFVQDLGDLGRFDSSAQVTQELVRCGRMTEFQQLQVLSGQGEKLIFGPYRLVKPLGEGGMGEVYKAWQPRLNRFIALKFVHKEYLNQPSAIGRFQREAHAIAQLQHANIVVVHDADEIDGIPFIAMEFIDGMSLADLVHRTGPLGVRQACEYMRQAALGLQHAFECGFVHRDIKPSNIMVSQPRNRGSSANLKKPALVTVYDLKQLSDTSGTWCSHHVKILDMGLARLSDSLTGSPGMATPLTAIGAIVGTPEYLSPEQARDPSKVDIRADLYSLGCTFYYILSGRPPFPGGTQIEKMIKHQFDVADQLGTLRRGLPEAITRIVERLLAKQPDDRFQTPTELVNALNKYLTTVTGEPEPLSPSRTQTVATFPSLIVPQRTLATTPALSSTDIRQPRDDKSLLVPVAESFPGLEKTIIPLDRLEPRGSDIEDKGREAPRNSPAEPRGRTKITSIATLEGHSGIVSGVAVTPDGKLAVSGDVNGQIRIWDLHDPIPRVIGSLHRGEEIQAIAIAPERPHDAMIGELRQGKAALVRWNWRSGVLIDWGDCGSLEQKAVGSLCFTTDGKMLAAGIGPLAVTWQTGNWAATNRKVYKGLEKSIRALAISPDRLLMAAAGQDKSIHFWDLERGRWNHNASVRVNSHGATITTMCFSPDGSVLALAGLDTEIALWFMAGDEQESNRVLRGHSSNLLHVQFIGDGSYLASVGRDGQILFWDVAKAAVIREFRLDLTMAYRVAISDDATRLIAGFANGVVGLYGLPALPKRSPSSESLVPSRPGSLEASQA